MRKIILSVFFLALGLAGCERWTPEKGVDHFSSKVKRELKLNPEQTVKLDDLTNSMKTMIKEDASKRSAMREDMKRLIAAPKLDTAKLDELMKNRQSLMTENMLALKPKLAAFHDSLSEEQRKKAADEFDEVSRHWSGEK